MKNQESTNSEKWKALKNWGNDITRIKSLTGGTANDVWSVCIDGKLAVARFNSRSNADLTWETELLRHLNKKGLIVPTPIPTMNGKLFTNGLVVMKYLEGKPPKTKSDWRQVAKIIRQVHQLTKNWSQRPGWKSSIDLLHANKGTKANLAIMPSEGVARCRAAWSQLVGRETSVIHGDLNLRNVLMTKEGVALIDWDESHIDVSELDLALPYNASNLNDDEYEIASQAYAAWEAVVCWDDDYSKRRLTEVKAVK